MRRAPLWMLLSLLVGGSGLPDARAELELATTPGHAVATRLEGTWRMDETVSARLDPGMRGELADSRLVFRDDPDVLTLIPAKYEPVFKDRPIRMAGTLKLWTGAVLTFALTEVAGTPTLIWFGERGDDPFGRTGTYRVALAAGRTPAEDLLFLSAGDGAPLFRAYAREDGAPGTE